MSPDPTLTEVEGRGVQTSRGSLTGTYRGIQLDPWDSILFGVSSGLGVSTVRPRVVLDRLLRTSTGTDRQGWKGVSVGTEGQSRFLVCLV